MQSLLLLGLVFALNSFPLSYVLGTPDIYPIADVIACDMYALPLMQGNGLSTSAAYYSGPGGTGSKYMVGDLIHSSGVLYAFDQDGMGTDEECFFIQIIDHLPDLSQIGSDTACTYYMLPYFITPSISGFAGYYTQPNAQGVRYQQGDTIFSSITLYAYDGYQSCSVEKEITVEIHDLPVFDQIPLQYGCHEYIFTPFSGENVFSDSIHFLLGNQTFYLEDITTTSGKVEVVAQNGTCFTADTFQLSIINKISIDPPGDTLICGFRFLLPAITGINLTENAKYYTELSGLGQAFLADETYNINNSSILYVFDQITGTDCIDEQIFSLNYINAPNAYKSFTTTVCKGYPYNIYELLLARNIERKSNKIYSINDQVALEPGSIFNTADYPPGEYLFYVIDSASYPCINDTAIMTVVVTINCTNADKNEIYCLNNHDYPLLLATNLINDANFVLGGVLLNEDFEPFLGWNQSYLLDRSTVKELTFYYLLQNINGKVDTSKIVVNIVQNIQLDITSSQNILCKGECTNIKIDFLDDDSYLVLNQLASAIDVNLLNLSFIHDSLNRKDEITICYSNTNNVNNPQNPDTLYLPFPNHEYDFKVWLIDSLKECQKSPNKIISLHTLEENTFFYNEILCPGENVIFEGEEFNKERPHGEILLSTPAHNGCDSFIYVNLSFYPRAVSMISEEICDSDTVIINCTVYTPEFSIDTQLLAGGGAYGCDSLIIIDLRFTKPQPVTIDTTLCDNQKLTIGGINFENEGNFVGVIKKENLCDSINYNVTIHRIEEEVINIHLPGSLCEGDTGIITVGNLFESIIWSTGSTNEFISIIIPGEYSVSLLDFNGCISDTTFYISFSEGLDIYGDFYYQGIINDPISLDLSSNSGVSFIEWQPATGLNCSTCLNPIATLLQSQVYTFMATNDHGCIDTGTVFVEIRFDIKNDVYIPNIFNPMSKAGENKKFRIFTKGGSRKYDLSIFDRWGSLLYKKDSLFSNNALDGWDGTRNNNLLQSGSYVYKIVIEGNNEPIIGSISLIH